MLKISIKASNVSVVVDIKFISKKKPRFSVSLHSYKRKLWSFIAKEMFIVNDIQKSVGFKKSIFWKCAVLMSMLKSLKYTRWILCSNF